MPADDGRLMRRARLLADRIVLGLQHDSDEVVGLGVDLLAAGHDGHTHISEERG